MFDPEKEKNFNREESEVVKNLLKNPDQYFFKRVLITLKDKESSDEVPKGVGIITEIDTQNRKLILSFPKGEKTEVKFDEIKNIYIFQKRKI